MSDKRPSENYIVNRAVTILENARANILERDKSYNSNNVSFEDYRLNGLESCVEEVLENIVRLWNSKSEDKAEDCAAYMALMCAFIQEGIPQSKFSPAFNKLMPTLWTAIKRDDERTCVCTVGEVISKRAM